VRIVLKQRFLTEWQEVAKQKLIKTHPEKEFRPGMRREQQKDPTDLIDLNAVEHELDTVILESFMSIIDGLKKLEEKNFEAEKLRMKQAARQENKMETMRTLTA